MQLQELWSNGQKQQSSTDQLAHLAGVRQSDNLTKINLQRETLHAFLVGAGSSVARIPCLHVHGNHCSFVHGSSPGTAT